MANRNALLARYCCSRNAVYIKLSSDLEGINILDKEFKISPFADDTALFLKNVNMVSIAINKSLSFSKHPA